MIGDTGSGTCLTIAGSNTFAIEHPTLTCSRLNVSESNTPIPIDRTYASVLSAGPVSIFLEFSVAVIDRSFWD
jgi:hypothetical protein